ncbi:hypothetical protein HDU91_006831, partial [Kappamyces sp. JEL0680]
MSRGDSDHEYAHLQDGFAYDKLTISQLSSLLSHHGVELPEKRERKEVYVALFKDQVWDKRNELLCKLMDVQPSAAGIEFVKSKIPVRKSPTKTTAPQDFPIGSLRQSNGDEQMNDLSPTGGSGAAKVVRPDDASSTMAEKRKNPDGPELQDESTIVLEKKLKPAEHEPWAPSLAWKLGKPPTPMQLKARRIGQEAAHLAGERQLPTNDRIPAPKSNRFLIQPQLPGVEHLKPVKAMVAKFDDGIPVKPLGSFLNEKESLDTDSTLSDAAEDSFLDKDSFLVEDGFAGELVPNDDVADEIIDKVNAEELVDMIAKVVQDSDAAPTTRSRWSTFKTIRNIALVLLAAITLTWLTSLAVHYSSEMDLAELQSRVKDTLVYTYENPQASLRQVKDWSIAKGSSMVEDMSTIEWT